MFSIKEQTNRIYIYKYKNGRNCEREWKKHEANDEEITKNADFFFHLVHDLMFKCELMSQ